MRSGAAHARGPAAAALAVLLAACAPAPQRPSPTPAPTIVHAAPEPSPAPIPELAPAPAVAPASPWQRLRARFALQGCDYRPQVQHWARVYTRSPRSFQAQMNAALPLLELVTDEVERRDLPGEFAMLPFVESDYRPLPGRGKGAAGMWQLMPATARAQGLRIGADYDARLDALDSTRVALDLLADYYKEFADWRLADFAFNAGEFRVKKLLGERDARTLSADELGRMPLRKVSHDHLDRLLALSCIIEQPQRYGVQLPAGDEYTPLAVVPLEAGMSLRLAARLAALPIDALRTWNAAHRRDRMDARAPRRLLLPQARIAHFQSEAARIAPAMWNDWHEAPAGRSGTLASFAQAARIAVDALAAANAMSVDAHVTHATRLLLPGSRDLPSAQDRLAASGIHVVAAGDTLSAIARRHGLSLRVLRALNPQAQGRLRIGSHLRLAQDSDSPGTDEGHASP